MENLLKEYQTLYDKLACKIKILDCELENENLRNKERECLKARHDLLQLEQFEVLDAMNEMRKHL